MQLPMFLALKQWWDNFKWCLRDIFPKDKYIEAAKEFEKKIKAARKNKQQL